MFHSARLKLTLFYLAAILALSLTLSFGIRSLAQREFQQSNTAQREAYRGIVGLFFCFQPTNVDFEDFQQIQEAIVRQRLNNYVVYINVIAFMVGGLASYWFAGRTLRPIEEAHDAQKRFASDASHELRTPLANIKIENEVFLRQKDFNKPEARKLIESNLEEVQRLESLSSSLLALTQYENANLGFERLPVRGLVDKVLQQHDKALTYKHLTAKNATNQATIQGHEESLVQMLSIILDNAIKYSPPKSTITINGKKSGNTYVFAVSDQGSGIDPVDLPFIFDKLYRGDKARSSTVPGYGLGLSLAKHIAKANKATIGAVNSPKGGAVFTITISLK